MKKHNPRQMTEAEADAFEAETRSKSADNLSDSQLAEHHQSAMRRIYKADEAPTFTKAVAELRLVQLMQQLGETLEAASDHLEYCGYGDKWENECARESNLRERIEQALNAWKASQ